MDERFNAFRKGHTNFLSVPASYKVSSVQVSLLFLD